MAADYETELKETEKQRKEILKKAREDAEHLLANVNKRIENTILEIKKAQAEKEKTKIARQKLTKLKAEVEKDTEKTDQRIAARMEKLRRREEKRNQKRPTDSLKTVDRKKTEKKLELKPGDKVRFPGQQTVGDLIELNEKTAVVAFGQLITTLPRNQVERVSRNEAKKVEKTAGAASRSRLPDNFPERRLCFKPDIDIRGQRAEEAIRNIQEFIDEAIMFEATQLRILHGKGQGILKETIRNYLRTEPMVRSFHDEHVDLGGAGITVVNLAL